MDNATHLGLDVHKDTIAVVVLEIGPRVGVMIGCQGHGTIAKARTGKVPIPSTRCGTAKKSNPSAGSVSRPVRCSMIGISAASRIVCTGRSPVCVPSMLTESIPTSVAPPQPGPPLPRRSGRGGPAHRSDRSPSDVTSRSARELPAVRPRVPQGRSGQSRGRCRRRRSRGPPQPSPGEGRRFPTHHGNDAPVCRDTFPCLPPSRSGRCGSPSLAHNAPWRPPSSGAPRSRGPGVPGTSPSHGGSRD